MAQIVSKSSPYLNPSAKARNLYFMKSYLVGFLAKSLLRYHFSHPPASPMPVPYP